MKFAIPEDLDKLKEQVLAYMHHMGADIPADLAKHLSARYLPGNAAVEGSVAVRFLSNDQALMGRFDGVMDAVGADIRKRDDLQTIRLDNWPARWATTLSPAPLLYIAGPNRAGNVTVEFFDELNDVPVSIYQEHADGRLFSIHQGLPI